MPNDALVIISDILDKMIDNQKSMTEASVSLKSTVQDTNEILDDIRVHFTNGFRLEIKDHITKELDEQFEKDFKQQEDMSKSLQKIDLKLDILVDTLTKPWFWIKLVGTVVVSLGVIIAATSKILQYVN